MSKTEFEQKYYFQYDFCISYVKDNPLTWEFKAPYLSSCAYQCHYYNQMYSLRYKR